MSKSKSKGKSKIKSKSKSYNNSKNNSNSKSKSKKENSTCFAVSKYLSPGQYPYSASSASEGPSSCFPRELLLQ